MAATENVAQPPAEAREETTADATGWRRWVPWVLVVLAMIITLVAALNIWVKRQALDTTNFADASSQLIENEDVRNALSVYLVNQLYENVDVSQVLEERLPPATQPLAAPLATALQPALVRATDTLLGRPRIQAAFKQAVTQAHRLFIAVLDGDHEVLQSTGGNVVLNLRPILEALVNQTGVGQRILQRLPPDAGQITVMKGSQLETARRGVRLIRATSYFLLFLVLALIAAAMYIARGRRRTILLASGVGIVIVGLVILIVHRLAGSYVVDALTNNPDAKKPVTAVWAIETQLLRNVGINAIIYGLLAVIAAWLAGTSRPATYLRRVALHERPLLGFGALAIVVLILLVTGPTDGDRIYPLLFVSAVAFIGLEALRRESNREFADAPPPAAAPS